MAHKILTVDDSKTIRMIVAKTLKPFDCQIVEAANGAEGLEAAAREKPDLIILDITMPVMDGVEMLTRLKADPALKAIPVMMLTAESGRDNVLKIAKLGIRDYLVKPFKEEQLLEKAGKIINLQAKAGGKAKTLEDPAVILVVEDKPAIIQQITEGLKSTPWKIAGVASPAEAMTEIGKGTPDAIIVSLSLPEDGGFNFHHQVKGHAAAKAVPTLGMCVKTDTASHSRAEQMGFSGVVTKPIDFEALKNRLIKLMGLDTSTRYFTVKDNVQIVIVPDATCLFEVEQFLKPKINGMVDNGMDKLILDLTAMKVADTNLVKFITGTMQQSQELAIKVRVAGAAELAAALKAYQETSAVEVKGSVDEAKGSF